MAIQQATHVWGWLSHLISVMNLLPSGTQSPKTGSAISNLNLGLKRTNLILSNQVNLSSHVFHTTLHPAKPPEIVTQSLTQHVH